MGLLFFLVIIIALPILVSVHIVVRTIFYELMQGRNRRVEGLAREFGLLFTPELPSYWRFLWTFRDIAINNIEGLIRGHHIVMRDCYRFSFKDPIRRYQQFTWVEIDGKLIDKKYNSFRASSFLLNSIYELRKLLAKDLQT